MSDDLTGKKIKFGPQDEAEISEGSTEHPPFLDANAMQDALIEAGILLNELAPPLAKRLGEYVEVVGEAMQESEQEYGVDADASAIANEQTIYATFKCQTILIRALHEAAVTALMMGARGERA